MVDIIQVNMNRAAAAQAELAVNVVNSKLDLALLQDQLCIRANSFKYHLDLKDSHPVLLKHALEQPFMQKRT
jgi:hypothetical protein